MIFVLTFHQLEDARSLHIWNTMVVQLIATYTPRQLMEVQLALNHTKQVLIFTEQAVET